MMPTRISANLPWHVLAGGAFGVAVAALGHFMVPGALAGTALWGEAILAAEGRTSFVHFVTFYPPLPYLAASAAQLAGGWTGLAATAIAAAALGAGLSTHWARVLEARHHGSAWVGITLLIVLQPYFLWSVWMGPGEILLVLFVYLLSASLFTLRARCHAHDAMNTGLALAALPFCHPSGLAIALVALPFSLMAVPPRHLGRSATGMLLLIAFPLGFTLMAFAMLSWAFGETGSSVLPPLTPGQITGAARNLPFADAFPLLQWTILGLLSAVYLAASFPLLLFLLAKWRRRPPLLMPVGAMVLTALISAPLAVGLGLSASLTQALMPFSGLLAAVVVHGPERPLPPLLALPAHLFGMAGSILFVTLTSSQLPSTGESREADFAMGRALAGLEGVLIDTRSAPELVAIRGTASGLITSEDQGFRNALMGLPIDSPHVLAGNPAIPRTRGDRLSRSLPGLYSEGLPGYRLIHDAGAWRLYARDISTTKNKGLSDEYPRRR